MEQPNIHNIPAYQRKRSIAAKANKKPNYDFIGKVSKQAKTTKQKTVKRTKEETTFTEEMPIETSFPSENIFSNHFINTEPAPKNHPTHREMKTCGYCDGYIDKIEVAIVKLTRPLRVGDSIIFEKQEGLFEQEVDSMQIDRVDVTLATTGSDVGLKVYQKPTVGSPVYKVIN